MLGAEIELQVAEALFPAILLPSFVGEFVFALWLTVRAGTWPDGTRS